MFSVCVYTHAHKYFKTQLCFINAVAPANTGTLT